MWKYSTGNRSAWRASSQRCAALAWHFGQCRSRQVTECTPLRALWEVLSNGELQIRFDTNATGRVGLVPGWSPVNSP
jgi:hypothetical protein